MTARGAAVQQRRLGRWLLVVVLLLAAWALRLCRADEVPPGWRDDELINMHVFSGDVLAGSHTIYFTGASGHEPLYHYVQAAVQGLIGINVLGGHILPASLGLLSIALTYTLASRLCGRTTAAISSAALAVSFWSLMYSRIGLRHISVVPFALASVLLMWRGHVERGRQTRTFVWLGIVVGLSMYTYFASRLLPVLLLVYLLYQLAFHRLASVRERRGVGLALIIAIVLVAPLALTIAQGVGADPRITELAGPIRSLRSGDPGPLLKTSLGTLGMFTTTGDPEWLYNIAGRPVFNVLGGGLLWVGVAGCLLHWRRPDRFLVLLWFLIGLAPALVSVPPASLGHTILAQPAAYVLAALGILEIGSLAARFAVRSGREPSRAARTGLLLSILVSAAFLSTNVYRDLSDYFGNWPRESLVRFLYRADYRDVAHYMDDQHGIADVAVGSALMGPWDRLALESEFSRTNVRYRLFNPDRALIWVAGEPSALAVITDFPDPGEPFGALLTASGPPAQIGDSAYGYELPAATDSLGLLCGPEGNVLEVDGQFANGLVLEKACWVNDPANDDGMRLFTMWHAIQALDLPTIPVVANPPPPGVYAGARLAVFAHLVGDDGEQRSVDDGLWVDPLTLISGDRFAQLHLFALRAGGLVESTALEIGLYDPMTGERVALVASGLPNSGGSICVPTQ